MSIFNKVTLQSLKKNRTRTIVTIIGIMLSAAMICAVTTFVASMQNYALDYATYLDGDWHGAVNDTSLKNYEKVCNDEKIADSTYNQILGYSKIDSTNEFKPYMYVVSAEREAYFDMMPIHMIEGEYPNNSGEIIVPEHVMSNGGLEYEIGDEITLELGARMLDGYMLTQSNPCYEWDEITQQDVLNKETIEVKETRTYKITGIYMRPSFEQRSAPGYTAITVEDDSFTGEYNIDMYFKLKKASDIYEYMEEKNLSGSQNTDVLLFTGVSRYSTFSHVLLSFAAIVIGLIVFGSVSLIYNAFSISVSERTKQFGLLSSIGATKKQLKKMVIFEAFAVSLIGIPLGIFAGIAGIAVTLELIGGKFTTMLSSYSMPIHVCVSWESIVIAIIIALVTVLISAWIPSRRAMKVSAVEAIRQNKDIKNKKINDRMSGIIYRIFGLSGVIANKHYKRNKKKYRTTVFSLFMSIVLFVSTASFTGYLVESVEGGFGVSDYEMGYTIREEFLAGKTPDDVLKLFREDENVTGGAYTYEDALDVKISDEYITDKFKKMTMQSNPDFAVYYSGVAHFVDDDSFDEMLSQYNLNKDDYYVKGAPVGIAVDNNVVFDSEQGKYITMDVFKSDEAEISCEFLKTEYNGCYYFDEDTDDEGNAVAVYIHPDDSENRIEIPRSEAYITCDIKVNKVVTEFPYYVSSNLQAPVNIVYPVSMREYVFPKSVKGNDNIYYYIQSDDHKVTYENVKNKLIDNGLSTEYLHDFAEDKEANQNTILIIQVFSYGFITLISLIAATNVFNTISTNISLRRREFAMLKSVGMTQKGFNKMMNFECVLYGSKALLYGLPASAGLTYLIYKAASGGYDTTFYLPWKAMGIATLSVFLVVFVTMLYSMSKIRKENPIDALKNENI